MPPGKNDLTNMLTKTGSVDIYCAAPRAASAIPASEVTASRVIEKKKIKMSSAGQPGIEQHRNDLLFIRRVIFYLFP